MAEQWVTVIGGKTMRLVTHLDVTAEDVDQVAALMQASMSQQARGIAKA